METTNPDPPALHTYDSFVDITALHVIVDGPRCTWILEPLNHPDYVSEAHHVLSTFDFSTYADLAHILEMTQTIGYLEYFMSFDGFHC